MEAINKVITSQNAGNCTAYELRFVHHFQLYNNLHFYLYLFI